MRDVVERRALLGGDRGGDALDGLAVDPGERERVVLQPSRPGERERDLRDVAACLDLERLALVLRAGARLGHEIAGIYGEFEQLAVCADLRADLVEGALEPVGAEQRLGVAAFEMPTSLTAS